MICEQPLRRQWWGTHLFTIWLPSDSKIKSSKYCQAEEIVFRGINSNKKNDSSCFSQSIKTHIFKSLGIAIAWKAGEQYI